MSINLSRSKDPGGRVPETVRLHANLYNQVRQEAKALGMSASNLMATLIEGALKMNRKKTSTMAVEMCDKCDDIHLVVETWDSEVAASIGFADETWEQLFKDYYTMKNKRDKGLGAKLNG